MRHLLDETKISECVFCKKTMLNPVRGECLSGWGQRIYQTSDSRIAGHLLDSEEYSLYAALATDDSIVYVLLRRFK